MIGGWGGDWGLRVWVFMRMEGGFPQNEGNCDWATCLWTFMQTFRISFAHLVSGGWGQWGVKDMGPVWECVCPGG